MSKEIILKSMATEAAGTVTETAFSALATSVGFPGFVFAGTLVKGLVLGLIENCFNNCNQMTLSRNEKRKLDRVSSMALQTFRERAEEDGVVAWEMNLNMEYFDYAYEVAEHATLDAIKQSETTKIDILGRYYGGQFYKGNTDWQDMHQMITMTSMLTLRQIVVIRLISQGFNEVDENLFIGNPSACVEINRLKDYGIWKIEGAAFEIDESAPIQIKSITATEYASQVAMDLMLNKLSEDDVKRTIESLQLTAKGKPLKVLSPEKLEKATTFGFKDNGLVLPEGISFENN